MGNGGGRMKTTRKDFDYFARRCRYWAIRFGMGEWELRVVYEDASPTVETLAGVWRNGDNRVATVHLSKDWKDDVVTRRQLDVCASEEILHCLLNRLQWMAGIFVQTNQVREEEHVIIHHIQYALGIEKGGVR